MANRLRTALFLPASVALACSPPRAPAPAPDACAVGAQGGCPGATDAVRGLTATMSVDIYATRSFARIDAFATRLVRLLAPFRDASGGRLVVTVVDVKDAAAAGRAREAGMVEAPVDETGNPVSRRSGAKLAFLGFSVRYGGRTTGSMWLDPLQTEGLVEHVVEELRRVREQVAGEKHTIGVLTGHGEGSVHDPLVSNESSLATALGTQSELRFVDVDLRDGDRALDPSIEGLVVLAPQQALTEDELRAIDAFVLRGRKLVVAAAGIDVAPHDQAFRATPAKHGLGRLLAGYGVELRRDVILDRTHPLDRGGDPPFFEEPDGGNGIVLPALIRWSFGSAEERSRDGALVDRLAAPLFRLPELELAFASSLELDRRAQPDARLRALVRTSPEAERIPVDEELSLAPRATWPTGPRATYVLAASVDGVVKSAFGPTKSVGRAGVLVLSSAAPFANPFQRALEPDGRPANAAARQLARSRAWNFASNGHAAFAAKQFHRVARWIVGNDEVRECLARQ